MIAAKDAMVKFDGQQLTGAVLESLITRGDISGLGPQQKTAYYAQLCERVGLDAATAPFQPLKLNGKEILYATKGAAEQLRKLHRISVTIVGRERLDDVYFVTARATMADGRADESQGAVSIAGLKGENLANAVMKAETKAKRRVTLSIVGLGMLDESELETIPANRFEQLPQEAVAVAAPKAQIVAAAPVLPALPSVVTTMPLELCKGVFKPLAEFDGVPLQNLSAPDLEMIISLVHDNRGRVKSETAKAWLLAIEATATDALRDAQIDSMDVPPPTESEHG